MLVAQCYVLPEAFWQSIYLHVDSFWCSQPARKISQGKTTSQRGPNNTT
jgi:hypothetical protein